MATEYLIQSIDMSLLRIHLSSSWPDLDPAAPLPWCRIGARGEALESGVAAAAAMPRADACELVVPAELILLTRAHLPRGSKPKLRQLLAYAIEDQLGGDPDAVHVAMGPALADGRTTLAAIDKAWLDRVVARLAGAGLRPRSAWPEVLLPALPADGWAVVWDGHGGFLRSGPQAGMAFDGGSAAEPPAALVLSVTEARAAGSAPTRVRLRLPDETPAPDVQAWGEALGLDVETGEPWAPLAHPEAATGGINLLQGAFAPAGAAREWWPAMRVPLILAGLIVAVHAGATTVEWWRMKHETRQLRAAMERSFREAFPDARVVVDAPLQMQRNLAELRQTAGQVTPFDFVPLLARTAAALDDDSRNRLRAVQYGSSQLTLELDLPDHAAADALVERLAAAGLNGQLQEGGTALARIVVTGGTS